MSETRSPKEIAESAIKSVHDAGKHEVYARHYAARTQGTPLTWMIAVEKGVAISKEVASVVIGNVAHALMAIVEEGHDGMVAQAVQERGKDEIGH